MNWHFRILLACVSLLLAMEDVRGQQKTNQPAPQSESAQQKELGDKSEPDVINGSRRDVILKFVRENHSEMHRLIASLEKKHPHHYQKALHSIETAIQKLNEQKEKDEKRYQQALDEWKLQSRIQLLSAQLSVADDPKRRKQLSELFNTQYDRKIKQLTETRDRFKKRLEGIEDQLHKITMNRESEIESRIKALVTKSKGESSPAPDKNEEQPEIAPKPTDKSSQQKSENKNTE